MGLFSRKKTQEPAPVESSTQRDVLATSLDAEQTFATQTAETAAPASGQFAPTGLGAGEGLKAVVKLMRAKAEGQVTLNLTQNANDMKYTLYQRGQEVESGLVTPGSEWFQAVADLYVEEEKSERGAWNRALIVVNPAIGSDAAVHASFMNTATSKTHNLNYALDMGAAQAQHAGEAGQAGEAQQVAEAEQGKDAAAEAGSAEEAAVEEAAAEETPEVDAAYQQGAVTAAAAKNYPATASVRSAARAEEAEPAEEVAPVEDAAPVEGTTAADENDAHQLPTHLDDSEFEADDQPQASAAPAQAHNLPASAPTLDAPMTGTSVDIAPSYAEHSQPKPSATKKASGNLVLTEAEVVSRFAPAYEALFGADGTARDVSTVLIRVRTLGSYYDALTHVRRNGFWEQVRTFDLIPEETLSILQLKADSYKEGHGSPLAINIRFTPGTPVEASFDYADEEAFVRYPEHLPAQQYVEELRMFPRTGENIPAHMSQALASWTF